VKRNLKWRNAAKREGVPLLLPTVRALQQVGMDVGVPFDLEPVSG
jgi:hypothetical protein